MGKHEPGYVRQDRDFYPTPAWPIEALAEQVDLRGKRILECACGDGRMARALEAACAYVTAFDIADYDYGGCVISCGMNSRKRSTALSATLPTGLAARRPRLSSKRAFGASATGKRWTTWSHRGHCSTPPAALRSAASRVVQLSRLHIRTMSPVRVRFTDISPNPNLPRPRASPPGRRGS
jgi:hypothetical protein